MSVKKIFYDKNEGAFKIVLNPGDVMERAKQHGLPLTESEDRGVKNTLTAGSGGSLKLILGQIGIDYADEAFAKEHMRPLSELKYKY